MKLLSLPHSIFLVALASVSIPASQALPLNDLDDARSVVVARGDVGTSSPPGQDATAWWDSQSGQSPPFWRSGWDLNDFEWLDRQAQVYWYSHFEFDISQWRFKQTYSEPNFDGEEGLRAYVAKQLKTKEGSRPILPGPTLDPQNPEAQVDPIPASTPPGAPAGPSWDRQEMYWLGKRAESYFYRDSSFDYLPWRPRQKYTDVYQPNFDGEYLFRDYVVSQMETKPGPPRTLPDAWRDPNLLRPVANGRGGEVVNTG